MMTLDFKNPGDRIYLIGTSRNDLGSSEYLRTVCEVEYSPCPHFDLEEEFFIQQIVKTAIRQKMVSSVHDVSDGGVFTALLEKGLPRGLGFAVQSNPAVRKDAWLFGEAQSRVIVTVEPEQSAALERLLAAENCPFEAIGTVIDQNITIDGEDWGITADWQRIYDTVLPDLMG